MATLIRTSPLLSTPGKPLWYPLSWMYYPCRRPAGRGIVVSYESIREWGLRFGRLFANALKRRRAMSGR